MKFGINTFLFTSPFTQDSVRYFKKFREWGFDFVEIALEDPSNINPYEVRKALDAEGFQCLSICAAMGPERDLRGNEMQQETAIKYLKEIMDIMPILGATILCGPLYSSVGRASFVPSDEHTIQFNTIKNHLIDLSEYAKSKGLMLAIEPLNRFETDFINTCEQGLELADSIHSESLGLHLDTFHMNIEEKSQSDSILKAGSKLKHFHASGSDRGTPGNDHIHWKEISLSLKAINYNGSIVIESFTTDVKEIAKAAAIWREIEPSQEDIAVKGLEFLRTVFPN